LNLGSSNSISFEPVHHKVDDVLDLVGLRLRFLFFLLITLLFLANFMHWLIDNNLALIRRFFLLIIIVKSIFVIIFIAIRVLNLLYFLINRLIFWFLTFGLFEWLCIVINISRFIGIFAPNKILHRDPFGGFLLEVLRFCIVISIITVYTRSTWHIKRRLFSLFLFGFNLDTWKIRCLI
jgi:hypothetical protein